MEIYDTEEEQVAAIKRWWKENGVSTIAGVVVGIVLIVGWNAWESNVTEKAHKASELYDQLQVSFSKDNIESTQKIVEKINQEHGDSAYADYAALLLAKTKVQQNDLEAAKSILETQMNTADSNALRNVARLRFVRLLQSTGENEKGLQLISEVDQTSIKGFAASYDELKGDLYVALDRLGEARTAYQSALRAGAKSSLLQFKLDDIAAIDVVSAQE